MARIDVGPFKVGENQLAGGGVVAMGPKQHVGELKLCCYCHEVL